jgi:NitT/TauT family transport system permease protein
MKRALPPIIVLIVVIAALELTVRCHIFSAYLVPPPSLVFRDIATGAADLWPAFWTTTESALIGFALSALLGVAIAVLLSSAQWIQRAFYPYAVFFQTVPVIAIAPLLVIWLGYGQRPVIASAFIVSIFPMIANTLAGLLSTDPGLRDMFRLYDAGPIATLLKLRLPAALPSIMTGLRITAGLAVIGSIVGEFIGGGGLGSVVDIARRQQRTDIVFAAVLLASLLGLALFALVNLLSALVLGHWHPSEQHLAA